MAKRLSEKEKLEIVKSFNFGKTIDEISKEFNRTKLTITRNLKLILGQGEYKELINKKKSSNQDFEGEEKFSSLEIQNKSNKNNTERNSYENSINQNSEEKFASVEEFIELTPLNYKIEDATQKDLSSVPISDIKFPKIVYMIVDNKIELEIKYLKDYPGWQFLSQDELNRKTIEIHLDLKIARGFCKKEQKVIKVPNPEVFKITAPILLSRGISRIVIDDKLIAL